MHTEKTNFTSPIIEDEGAIENTPEKVSLFGKVANADLVNVRTQPSKDGIVKFIAKRGEQYEIESEDVINGFIPIIVNETETAYISQEYFIKSSRG